MPIKFAAAVAGLVTIVLPIAVFANQPAVKLSELAPAFDNQQALALLLLDPYAETALSVTLPAGFATLDVDADPFAVVAR